MNISDSEDMIIGTITQGIEQSDLDYFLDTVKEDCFSTRQYRDFYKLVKDLRERDVPVTLDTLRLHLSETIHKFLLLSYANSSAEFKEAVNVLRVGSIEKQMRSIMNEETLKIKEAEILTEADIEFARNSTITRLSELQLTSTVKTTKLGDDIESYMEYLCDLKDGKIERGIMTGYNSIDEITNGFKSNQLIILGAYESIGKTMASLNWIVNMLKENKKVLLFSLEMSKQQLTDRLVSIISGVPLVKLKNQTPLLDDEFKKIGEALIFLQKSKLFINTDFDITTDKMMAYAMKIKKQEGLDIVFIDHIHLLGNNESQGKDLREKMSYISRNLKRLTKNADMPVIALAQLNRDSSDPYGLDIPSRKRLRESGSIEADADIVMIAHRFLSKKDGTPEDLSTQARFMLMFDKHRDGERRLIELFLDFETLKLYDMNSRFEKAEITIG